MVPESYYVALSAILFSIGVVGVVIRRNPLVIFMSIELMLNAANLALVAFGFIAKLGTAYYAAMPLVAAALFYEHRRASELDLAGINRAFFQSNAFVSAIFIAAVAVDRWR